MNTQNNDTLFKSKISNVTYRLATTDDAAELLKVYEPYVKNTAITYEYEVPSVEEFASRISDVLTKFPYIAVLIDGKISGYAYAHACHQCRTHKQQIFVSFLHYLINRGK